MSPRRLSHVQGVNERLHGWGVRDTVLMAAWLHDIGYSPRIQRTGMHALDGADYLDVLGAPEQVVSLVAFHTGAEYEAVERGLIDRLLPFDEPPQRDLDLLILADMTTTPLGEETSPSQRITEILTRYESQHPVHRAVSASQGYLLSCCGRAARRLGQPI